MANAEKGVEKLKIGRENKGGLGHQLSFRSLVGVLAPPLRFHPKWLGMGDGHKSRSWRISHDGTEVKIMDQNDRKMTGY